MKCEVEIPDGKNCYYTKKPIKGLRCPCLVPHPLFGDEGMEGCAAIEPGMVGGVQDARKAKHPDCPALKKDGAK